MVGAPGSNPVGRTTGDICETFLETFFGKLTWGFIGNGFRHKFPKHRGMGVMSKREEFEERGYIENI
jgi:hypothetical protein